ncbi:Nucleolar protein 58, partial [Ophiophagus hannah]
MHVHLTRPILPFSFSSQLMPFSLLSADRGRLFFYYQFSQIGRKFCNPFRQTAPNRTVQGAGGNQAESQPLPPRSDGTEALASPPQRSQVGGALPSERLGAGRAALTPSKGPLRSRSSVLVKLAFWWTSKYFAHSLATSATPPVEGTRGSKGGGGLLPRVSRSFCSSASSSSSRSLISFREASTKHKEGSEERGREGGGMKRGKKEIGGSTKKEGRKKGGRKHKEERKEEGKKKGRGREEGRKKLRKEGRRREEGRKEGSEEGKRWEGGKEEEKRWREKKGVRKEGKKEGGEKERRKREGGKKEGRREGQER